ncbi:receptor expression-enhancing protein 2 isoform X1 [Corvus kubaryi]|uniref:receptor expression-enhancing protein 2 isoform X1 n=1 Tax=Corvus kubaryi TaxID=68294 RepID=UPI001C03FB34|nr:receptor expression-enhancing protein 2 isoform X1 [Corvus kubaryi]
MASSVVSITLSSQVPVISLQHRPVIFLTLRILLLCYRSSNGTCPPHCCRSAGGAPLPGSRRTSRPGASERGASPRRGGGQLDPPGFRSGAGCWGPCGLSLRRVGSSHPSTRGGAALAAGTCPLRAASRSCSTLSRARRRHGLLDNLSPRGADLRHPLPRVLLLQGREDEKRKGICEVDDVLDCVCLFHHCRNTHRHCSFLEIDEYITQACDKSYETMMRVGKRGLNLAANAAVTAAAKGQGVLSEKLRSFSMQDLTLIRDEDTVHMRSRDPQLHPSGASLLETIEDSASCYSSGEESSVAHRSNGTPSDTRTDPSDEDAGDKLPKRTQSLKTPKKVVKAELPVRSVKARPKKKAAGSLASGESS